MLAKIKFEHKIVEIIKFLRLKTMCLRVSYKKKYEKKFNK
jgi:hypothetical protein